MKNEVSLSEDGKSLLLNITAELDAAALEDLLLMLGSIRESMKPPVPSADQNNGGAQLRCTSETLSEFAADKPDEQGNCLLRFRSKRFGWLGWRFAQHDARQLGEFLAAYFPPAPPTTTAGQRM